MVNDSSTSKNQLLISYYALLGEGHIDNIVEALSDNYDLIQKEVVPKSLDQWMHAFITKLVKEDKAKIRRMKVRKYGSRAAIFVLVLMTTLTVAGLSVDAIRVRFFNMMLDVKEEYTAITYETEDTEVGRDDLSLEDTITDQGTLEGNYYPTYIPEGYVEVERKVHDKFVFVMYLDDQDNSIIFDQSSLNGGIQIDTEDAVVTYPEINGIEGIMAEEDGNIILVWHNNEYSLSIIGVMDRATALNMAESIEKQ